ncbi:MAG: stage III sporulation protein AF [Clostridia bacterium]|nr:stage III sporulation protein AF [Clostridia bacterium]
MFNEWILKIIGIGAIGVLLDVLMPEGDTNKYIKSVFALITVFVVVSPLPKLFGAKLEFDDLFFNQNLSVSVDEGFLDYVYEQKYEDKEDLLEKRILGKYGVETRVKIRFVESCPEKIDVVYLYFKKSVIEENEENKYSIEEIGKEVAGYLNIGFDEVVVRYGE